MLAITSADFFQINVGNVITWAALLGTMFAAWQKIKDRLDHQETRMERVEKELNELAAKGVPAICALHDRRLAEIEVQVAKISTIANDVAWIKETIKAGAQRERE